MRGQYEWAPSDPHDPVAGWRGGGWGFTALPPARRPRVWSGKRNGWLAFSAIAAVAVTLGWLVVAFR